MTTERFDQSVLDVYADGAYSEEQIEAILDESLDPRGPDMLFDLAGELGAAPDARVLDVGCRDGSHLAELARRYRTRGVGVELLWENLARWSGERRRLESDEPDLASLVQLVRGRIETLPFADGAFDLVWSRDMLAHVPDLASAFAECRRVMARDARMLVFHMFATPWLEQAEAERLWSPLAVVQRNTDAVFFERAAADAGLRVVSKDEITSEWREHLEESGSRKTTRQLLHVARLLRGRDRFRELFGARSYDAELGDSLWGVYQMIGKLSARVYVLAKAS